ncbi:MAG TPA: DUF6351 family protein [Solirubrobacterales bacterium]|nr:DUF6351 family protein [Solirubrobacterales bacterium]
MKRTLTVALAAITLFLVAVGPGAAPASAVGEVELDVVSSRPDTASGGDSLVQVTLPPSGDPAQLKVALAGADVTSRFQPHRGNQRVRRALLDLDGATVGTVTASLPGSTEAKLLIVDHSINGPILSGVRQTPYICQTPNGPIDTDDCSAETTVEYRYRLVGDPWVSVPDPADIPAADLRTTTTMPTGDRPQGVTVPQVIRVETGTINRANYRIAFLIDPADPDMPSAAAWNGRLVYSFGGGCGAGYVQGGVGGENNYLRIADVLGGYATGGSSQNVFGTRCSDSVSAETVSMVKETFIERFRQMDFTIGKGGSGGAMAQQMIGNNFPGLLDGLQVSNSFTDNAFPGNQLLDCRLIDEFLNSPEAAGWTTEQKRSVKGLARETACGIVYGAFGANFFDASDCSPLLPGGSTFDPVTNPDGTRCTIYEGNINVYGIDPATGMARRPVDNVGVQYGLEPLRQGTITIEQFLDLNDGIGGIRQFDGVSVPERSVATEEAIRRAYDSGLLNTAGAGLAATPLIDNRAYNIETVDNGHQIIHALSMRERLLKANGDPDGDGQAGTQVIWTSPDGLDDALQLMTMDRWLSAIRNDKSARSKREKVLRNRPAETFGSPAATDACFTDSLGTVLAQETQTLDSGVCGDTYPSASGPRMEAGQPLANDILKCQLKPVDPSEYGVTLTGPQLTRLRQIFPQGTCDNDRPGVEFEINRKTWRALPATAAADTSPPDTAISSALKKRGQSNQVKLRFTSSETGSSFACRFDSARFSPCAAPLDRGNLRAGSHTFEVRATDIAGNTDPTPAKVPFVVGYPKASLALRSRKIEFNRRGRGYARVRCTLSGMNRCHGQATVSVKGRIFGARGSRAGKDVAISRSKYAVKAGPKRSVRVKLNGRAKRKLRRNGRIRAKIAFTVAQAGTSPKKVVRTVRLIRGR